MTTWRENTTRLATALAHGRWAVAALLVLVTVLAYAPLFGNGFVGWDDDMFLARVTGRPTEDEGVMLPVAFYPVFHGSLKLDKLLWGHRPAGYHIHSLLWHAGAVLLVFGIVRRLMRGGRSGLLAGATAATFFALHPVNVEAVAWVSGRDVVLASFFALGTMYAVVRQGATSGSVRWGWRVTAVACFVVACLSNAAVAALPLVLVAHDVLMLRQSIFRSLWRKWDLWLVGAAAVFLRWPGVLVKPLPKALLSEEFRPVTAPMVLRGMLEEIGSLVAPARLTALYPRAEASWTHPTVLVSLALIALSAAFVLWVLLRCRGGGWGADALPVVALGVMWFWVMLAPTFMHHIARADRHLYLPAVGLFLALGVGMARVVRRSRTRAGAAIGAGAGVVCLCALALLTAVQCKVWRNEVTLWSHAVHANPGQYTVQNNLGVGYTKSETSVPRAEVHLREAHALNPEHAQTALNYGMVLERLGKFEDALALYRQARETRPAHVMTLYVLGRLLLRLDRPTEAVDAFAMLARINNGSAKAHLRLADVLLAADRPGEALQEGERALALSRRSNADVSTQTVEERIAVYKSGGE